MLYPKSASLRLCLLLVACCLLPACQPSPQTPEAGPGPSPAGVELTEVVWQQTDTICPQKQCSQVTFVLPQATAGFEDLNRAIAYAAVQAWGRNLDSPQAFAATLFRDWHEEYQEDLKDADYRITPVPWVFTTKATAIYNANGLLSLRIGLQKQHGTTLVREEVRHETLRVPDALVLNLLGLFRPGSLDQLAAIAEDQYHVQSGVLLDPDYPGCSIRFDKCQFTLPGQFYLTDTSVVLAYQLSELGPPDIGAPQISVPFIRLFPLIDPAGPLGWALPQQPKRRKKR